MTCGVPNCDAPAAEYGVCEGHRRVEVLLTKWDDVPLEPEPRKPAPWVPPSVQPTNYGDTVLANAVAQIHALEDGNRNSEIVRIAFIVGGYIGGGEIDPERAHSEITAAAKAVGRRDWRQMVNSAERALRAGEQKPRRAPAPRTRPAAPRRVRQIRRVSR